ncbi:MAG: hypothetical protein KDB08_01560 [Microthrixaceae bacterium]|nr:hypothetical protein [Microthrixaceae bacterium]
MPRTQQEKKYNNQSRKCSLQVMQRKNSEMNTRPDEYLGPEVGLEENIQQRRNLNTSMATLQYAA